MRDKRSIRFLAAALLAGGCGDGAQHHGRAEPGREVHASDAAGRPVPLYTDLGTHHYAITTASPIAQQYFDQGLRLTYAFNHAEAIRAYEAALALDPECAMCEWGIAFAYGPNINAPMDEASGRAAYGAMQRARAKASRADERERALIEALATRYADPPPAGRAALDSAWAAAIGDVARRFPDDPEIATLHAEALMNLRPWDYWMKDGRPYAGTETIVATLERVIAAHPEHPGACHFYIHAVEAVAPDRAVPCADRLARLMPGAGHLVHMPAHIYIRVGRWNDAIEANIHAVHTDETYIADQRPVGVYPLAYYPHNYHFLAFAATMAGRSTQAIEAARQVVRNVDADLAKDIFELQGLVPYLHLALVTFGRWDEVLAEPLPREDVAVSYGLAVYAQGVARAAKGQAAEAEAAVARVAAIAATAGEPGRSILTIARHALQGEVASRAGDLAGGIAHFRAAMEIEDGLLYFEPPLWYYPIRHSLGRVLLEAGRAAEAERAYREDLARFPENGWSLFGLARSLQAQNRAAEAAEVEARLARAWDRADVQLTASRF
jgi:tetratricopeptide (TPR) repeat protein